MELALQGQGYILGIFHDGNLTPPKRLLALEKKNYQVLRSPLRDLVLLV